MSDLDRRYKWIVLTSRIWLGLTALAILGVMVLTGYRAFQMGEAEGASAYLYGGLMLLAELAGLLLAVLVCGVIEFLVIDTEALLEIRGRLDRVETLSNDTATSAKALMDLASLSDKAKGYIFREHESEALRETIRHHLLVQDYPGALTLIDSIEKDFGYAEEAEKLREEVAATRRATVDEKIDNAISQIQEIIDRHDWGRAEREAKRLIQAMPASEKIASLPQRIEAARTAHKRQLLQAYGDAVRKNDLDKSIDLLNQLDLYLSPQEAAALQESARGVFRAKLHNLGVQFAICVTDHRWAEAIATGQEIIRSYPNSRMAEEVRQKMDQLHTLSTAKAGEA
ncbi:MAG: hypothetical protein WC869_07570 [Phycisphaerae bacterium]|jgi:hypothetical protein